MAKNDIQFSLGIDSVAFQKGLKAAQAQVKEVVAAMKTVMIELAAILGFAMTAAEIAKLAGAAIQGGKALNDMARASGFTEGEIALLEKALFRADVGAKGAVETMKSLRNAAREASAGSEEFRNSFAALNINVAEFEKLSPSAQFQAVVEKIKAIPDPMMRSAMAAKMLGSEGEKIVATYQKGDMADAMAKFGKNIGAAQASAAAMARTAEAWTRIKQIGADFMAVVTAKVAPLLMKAAEALESIIGPMMEAAESFGQSLVDGIDIMVNAFKSGQLSELIWLALKAGFMVGLDYLVKGLAGAMNALAEMLGQAMAILVDGGFWGGVWNMIKGLLMSTGSMIAATLMEAFELPLKFLQDGMTWAMEKAVEVWGKITGSGFKARSFGDIQKQDKLALGTEEQTSGFFRKQAEESWKNVSKGGKEIIESAKRLGSMDEIVKAFQDGMNKAGIFGPEADAAMKKVKDFAINLLPKDRKNKPMPGKEELGQGPAGLSLQKIAAFDSLRAIGGGMGAGGDLAARQVDLLREIRDNTRLLKNPSQGYKGLETWGKLGTVSP